MNSRRGQARKCSRAISSRENWISIWIVRLSIKRKERSTQQAHCRTSGQTTPTRQIKSIIEDFIDNSVWVLYLNTNRWGKIGKSASPKISSSWAPSTTANLCSLPPVPQNKMKSISLKKFPLPMTIRNSNPCKIPWWKNYMEAASLSSSNPNSMISTMLPRLSTWFQIHNHSVWKASCSITEGRMSPLTPLLYTLSFTNFMIC